MHDLNTAIEAAKGGGGMTPALPGSTACAPPRSESWPRPRESSLRLRKLFYSLVSLVTVCLPSTRSFHKERSRPRPGGRGRELFWQKHCVVFLCLPLTGARRLP